MDGFSERSGIDRAENELTRTVRALKEAGVALSDLTVSNPTRANFPPPSKLPGQLLAEGGARRYEPAPLGLESARAAIAAELSQRSHVVQAKQVVVTASTSEAYSYLLKLLCNPADAVLVPAPSYPLLQMLCRYDGVEQRTYRLRYDGRWHIDRESLRAAMGPRVRAIVIVSPNNPTGHFVDAADLDWLRSLGLPLICDEVFGAYPLAASHQPSTTLAADPGAGLLFTLGGLSKYLGLPQLKLGWIVTTGPPRWVDEALARIEFIADTYLSVATPVQVALPELFRLAASTRLAIARRVRANWARVAAHFGTEGSPIDHLSADGGWYAVLRVPRILEDEGWAVLLAQEDRILVHPGAFYGFDGGAHLILSLLTEPEALAEALPRLSARVAAQLNFQ